MLILLLLAACARSVDDPGAGAAGIVDLERGELLALACRACHTFGSGEEHLLGPNLYGVFGRSTASAAGFEYSVALREADFVWTPDALDAWLTEPNGFIHSSFAWRTNSGLGFIRLIRTRGEGFSSLGSISKMLS